jgi:hypothetical protein
VARIEEGLNPILLVTPQRTRDLVPRRQIA